MHYEPASTVIDLLGGTGAVADLLGLHQTRVASWRRARSKGGTGGAIPSAHLFDVWLAVRRARLDVRLEAVVFSPEQLAVIAGSAPAETGQSSGWSEKTSSRNSQEIAG
jgi:hypothetical protein